MIIHSNLEYASLDFLLTQLFWTDTTIITQATLTFPLFLPQGAVTFLSSHLASSPGAETLWAGRKLPLHSWLATGTWFWVQTINNFCESKHLFGKKLSYQE